MLQGIALIICRVVDSNLRELIDVRKFLTHCTPVGSLNIVFFESLHELSCVSLFFVAFLKPVGQAGGECESATVSHSVTTVLALFY